MKSNFRNGYKNVIIALLPYFLIVGIIQYIGVFVSGIENVYQKKDSFQVLIISFFTLIGTLLFVLLVMRFVDKKSLRTLGLSCNGFKTNILLGLGIGFFIMFLSYLILLFFEQIHFQSFNFKWSEFVLFLFASLFTSFSEEILFRGYVLRNFMLSSNKYFALFFTSFLFSIAHFLNDGFTVFSFIDTLIGGVFLGLSYVLANNLWFSIALHFSWNFFQSLFGFNVSGQDFYSFFQFSYLSENIWNGGAFGFEGSVLSIILQLLTLPFIFLYFKKVSDSVVHVN